ncbi:alpha-glucosidase [Asticcacaulis sp. EMRT-3]|uniref:alpha-glucosidase n=1 Tax=Asticcacaulis sp. EMRT-3 TaxID=3040349 RepID=UPI0024AF9BB9|nr:alpha-glucosidase [Asticcacaulis sp. EMRT-3]MDI7776211.1 alpha-glucosidase [Asticcacaulis sp. EMRT-3]
MRMESINGYQRRWWKEAVVYQIYPRSFYDSNGDGIGDLRGIIEKLDHIKNLGVNVIWLSPHFDSPNADNGYDIRDYRKVGAEFGTMQDFDDLLAAIHAGGMRLIIDLVVNHTSDEHRWFVESRKGPDNPCRDYYIWHEGDQPPNDWTSIFGGSAWQRDGDAFYLHLFHEKQPDLNWDNPKVRHEVHELMRFWLDKGVDGFRMDVIPFISKDKSFPDLPAELRSRPQYVYTQGPHVHDYLHEMRREVLDHYDTMTVGEAFGVTLEQTPDFIDERRGELDMVFQFAPVEVDRDAQGRWKPWRLPELKAIFARQDAALGPHDWPAVFLSNHDNPRLVSRYGDDRPEWRVKSAQVLATLLLTLRGTPFIYQGDEIGMTNARFTDIEQFNDVWTKNAWRDAVATGRMMPAEFLADQNKISRDHARLPMAWNAGKNAGFSPVAPWFAHTSDFSEANVATDAASDAPIQRYYKRLISLRSNSLPLIYGRYTDLLPDHPALFIYKRSIGTDGFLIALNMSSDDVITDGFAGSCVFGNYEDAPPVMRGWEARIYRL